MPARRYVRAAQGRRRQPAVAGRLERGRESVLVGVERRGVHRPRHGGATGQVPEAHDRQLRVGGDRLEVVRLRAARREIGGDVVVQLHEPARGPWCRGASSWPTA